MRRFFPAALFVAALLFNGVAALAQSRTGGQDIDLQEEKAVERYLARVGLTDLQMLQLEKLLAAGGPKGQTRSLPAEEKLALAQQLADLYAEALLKAGEDSKRFAELKRRVEKLTENVPEARTASLEVMLLQADFTRAEAAAVQWVADRTKERPRDEAQRILLRITPLLERSRKHLGQRIDQRLSAMERLDEGAERDHAEKELARIQSVAARASYFAGWSKYYLGLLAGLAAGGPEDQVAGGPEDQVAGGPEDQDRKQPFAQARRIFRELLDIAEDEEIAKLSPEALGLESWGRSRALIGLGITEAALGNADACLACFRHLQHGSTPPQVRDDAPYWCVQGLLNAGDLPAAYKFAAPRIQSFSGNATQAKVNLCVALVRGALAETGALFGGGDPQRQTVAMLGITGLARLRQLKAARQLMEEYKIPLPADAGFYLRWAEGQRLLDIAERSKPDEKGRNYALAAEALEKALTAPDAKQEVGAVGRCRYQQAWCYYQTGELEKAAKSYEQAAEELKASKESNSPESYWMAFVCYQKLLKEKPRYQGAAIDALEALKEAFPQHPRARQADYYIRKVRQASSKPEETIRELQTVPPNSPSYSAAQYDLASLVRQLWRKDRGKSSATAAHGRLALEAVDNFLKAAVAAGASTARRRLRSALWGADVALFDASPQYAKAAEYLKQAESLLKATSSSPSSSPMAAEYHYLALQHALKTKADGPADTHAKWLVENAAGSSYELPALILTAKTVERRLKTETGSAVRQEAYSLYKRLVGHLGVSKDAISKNKNAQVALSRLAEQAESLSLYVESAQALENLLAVYPKNRSYLRRGGLANYRAGRYQRSLDHWRTLLLGASNGSSSWLEAKYYQLACLARVDKGLAKKVFKQYELLYPRLGPPPWRTKFQELKKGLQ